MTDSCLGSRKKERTCCTKHRNQSSATSRVSSQFESASGFKISKGDFSAIQGHRYGALHITGKTVLIQQGSSRRRIPKYSRYHDDTSSDSEGTVSETSTAFSGSMRARTPALSLAQELKLRAERIEAQEEELKSKQSLLLERETHIWKSQEELKQREEESKARDDAIRAREQRVQEQEQRLLARKLELDEREAQLQQRESELAKREKEVSIQGQMVEKRELNVEEREKQLKEKERELLALDARIKDQMVVMRERCAEIRGRKERFSSFRSEWANVSKAFGEELEIVGKLLEGVLNDFSTVGTSQSSSS